MGAPAVIAVPSKSYVAINSYKCNKSVPPTLCDLGRVSNIAAAVTLPRTSNFVNRNSDLQSARSLPHKKRPISEVMDYSNSNSRQENASTEKPTTNAVVCHKKKRFVINSHSSASSIAIPSVVDPSLDINHNSNPQAKIKKSTEASSKSTMSHGSKHQHLPNHLNAQLTTSGIGQLSAQHLLSMQLLQQNQQLHNDNVQLTTCGIRQLSANHLLSMQLLQQNQQLRNENVQLQKQLSLFRQLIKNPQRLNQVITRLEQRVH